MPIYSPLLSFGPRIRKRRGKLVAGSSWQFQVLTLGLYHREIIVDPKEEVVRFRRRYLWFWRRNTRLPFRSIQAITYSYQDLNWDAWWSWAHDSVDLYSVGLRLYSRENRHLFHFYGDGTFTNDGPLPDWWYWDDFLFDFAGTQEKESKMFVNALSKMIGVPVEPGSG